MPNRSLQGVVAHLSLELHGRTQPALEQCDDAFDTLLVDGVGVVGRTRDRLNLLEPRGPDGGAVRLRSRPALRRAAREVSSVEASADQALPR
jgi:hypothetical protein